MLRFITSIIFIAASVGVFIGFARPNFDEINNLNEQKVNFENTMQNSEELLDMRQAVLDKYNSVRPDDLVKLEKILPSKMEAITLIIELENIAKKQGLLLKDIGVDEPGENDNNNGDNGRFEAVKKRENYDTVSLNMTVVGSYSSFLSFLDAIEQSLHLIDIKNLSFTAGDLNSYEFNIKATTYWMK